MALGFLALDLRTRTCSQSLRIKHWQGVCCDDDDDDFDDDGGDKDNYEDTQQGSEHLHASVPSSVK